ncbi:porin family protein [Siansivirga zeaxanthinifaciens]|nr:porin family protein [Siansivirga zeaxanthinifaciens]
MKTIKIIFLFVFLVAQISNSQELQFGAKAGLNLTTISGDETEELEGKVSFHLGGYAELNISEKFTLQPEVLYSRQGTKESYDDDSFSSDYVYTFDYLNMPVMFKYYILESFSIELGSQIGVLISSKAEYQESEYNNSYTEDLKKFINAIDYGANIGFGYKLANGLNFSARYYLGLSNIKKDDNTDGTYDAGKLYNNVFQVSVGFTFN